MRRLLAMTGLLFGVCHAETPAEGPWEFERADQACALFQGVEPVGEELRDRLALGEFTFLANADKSIFFQLESVEEPVVTARTLDLEVAAGQPVQLAALRPSEVLQYVVFEGSAPQAQALVKSLEEGRDVPIHFANSAQDLAGKISAAGFATQFRKFIDCVNSTSPSLQKPAVGGVH